MNGVFVNGTVRTMKTKPIYDGNYTKLKDIIIKEKEVPREFFISEEDLDKWNYLKGAKMKLEKLKMAISIIIAKAE